MPLRSHFLFIAVLAVATAGLSAVARANAPLDLPFGFTEDVIVTGLDEPNSFAFLPDGRIVVAEQRTGYVRLIVNDHVAATDPAGAVGDVYAHETERGVQGIAVDPRWPVAPYVYICYTRIGQKETLVRYAGSGDLDDPLGENLSFANPLVILGGLRDSFPNHNAGTVRFGPDDHLYLTLGDDSDPCSAQLPDSTRGVVLRLDVTRIPDDQVAPVPRALIIPAEHPFTSPDSSADLVYAHGLRNPWRFHIDAADGLLYTADVGDYDWEEISQVRSGDNLGWPFREGNVVRTNEGCSEPGGPGGTSYVAPIQALSHQDDYRAVCTAGVYRPTPGAPSNWPPEYNGDVFFADHYLLAIRRLHRNGATWSIAPPVPGQPSTVDWCTGVTWIGDIQIGPDGSMWVLSQFDDSYRPQSGAIRRIRYNAPPAAVTSQPRTVLILAAPNPFADRVELLFGAPDGGPTRLDIHDAAGRRVRSLATGVTTGDARVVWDGRDERGTPVAAGIYLARLEYRGGSAALRLLRLR